jgi:hypothetical protein
VCCKKWFNFFEEKNLFPEVFEIMNGKLFGDLQPVVEAHDKRMFNLLGKRIFCSGLMIQLLQ